MPGDDAPIAHQPNVQAGETIPHFEVTTTAGERFVYSEVWQRKHLVLVVLPADGYADYVDAMERLSNQFRQADAVSVVTRGRVRGIVAPAALVADRWGEIAHIATAAEGADLPAPSELLEWVEYVGRRCPECEGEYR